MKRAWVAMSVGALILAACATEENYRKIMDTWVGAPESRLVDKMGPPTGFYERDGARYLTYTRQSTRLIPGTPPKIGTNYVTGEAETYGGTDPYTVTDTCATTFLVEKGVVTRYQYRGNDCVARDPK